MDLKKSLTIVIGVVVVAIVVVAIAAVAFNLINGNLSNEPLGPSATPGPSGSSVTPAPGATAGATPTVTPGSPTSGQIYVGGVLNETMGSCLVTIMLNKDAKPVDASKLSMNMECDGRTFSNVWKPSDFDMAGLGGNTMLDFNEVLAVQIDTVALGIPQGKPITIIILLNGVEIKRAITTTQPSL
ncbi:MAG: hypothetical protein WBZ29_09395 [Methanocella sp.]